MHPGGSNGDRVVATVVAGLAAALVATCGLAAPDLGATAVAAESVATGGAATGTPETGAPATAPAADRTATGHSHVRQRSRLDTGLEARLADRLAHATSGRYGMVVDIEGVGRVASLHPARALRPASTQKLFTTLPLLLSRADDRLVTDVSVTAEPVAGVVSGDLVIRSSEDPSLTKRNLGRLAHQIAAAGITRVTGDLILDIGSWPTNKRRSGWKRDFVPLDVGPLSPFPLNHDAWRRDRAYVSNPTAANLALFRKRLVSADVHVHGDSVVRRTAPAGTVVATHTSRSLADIITETLRLSDNFYAETLLTLGGGHKPVNATSSAAGVTDPSYATDGSGLSYDDRETARGEVTLLNYAQASPAIDDLINALPLGCRRGTLKKRFCHTIGAGHVWAKTGTLTHTSALAGYTTDALGRRVTFSVICGEVRSITSAMRAIDRAVLVLRRYGG
jgi:D-alanyl-D-alanine carboxypeptidase/D-alanyl-D-alanine-endopeptidase (penicillin-binding protein 4)